MSESSYQGPERRRHTRHNIHLLLHIEQLGQIEGVISYDLSEGGMFVATLYPLRIGTVLPLTIIHPHTGEELPLITKVVRIVANEDGSQRGVGLRFHNFDMAQATRLRDIIADLAPTPAPPEQVPPNPVMAQPEVFEIPPAVLYDGSEIPLNAVPQLLAMRQALSPLLLHLIMYINGRNSVEEIIRRCGLHVNECLGGLRELLDLDVIKVPGIESTVKSRGQPGPDDFLPEHKRAAEGFVTDRAQEYLRDAIAAHREGKIADAIRLLQLALAMRPDNMAEIHKHLARIAFQDLLDYELAKEHAIAGLTLNPEQPELHKMVQEIRMVEAENLGVKTRDQDLAEVDQPETEEERKQRRAGWLDRLFGPSSE